MMRSIPALLGCPRREGGRGGREERVKRGVGVGGWGKGGREGEGVRVFQLCLSVLKGGGGELRVMDG